MRRMPGLLDTDDYEMYNKRFAYAGASQMHLPF